MGGDLLKMGGLGCSRRQQSLSPQEVTFTLALKATES